MAVHEHSRRQVGFRRPSLHKMGSTRPVSEAGAVSGTAVGSYAVAGLRLVTGFVFLWAFLDKSFGFGYATPSGKGWIDGGSPTRGFLSGVAAVPMQSTFHAWAGDTWVDWLFMAGLLGVGVALLAGVMLRPAAVAGTLMMAFMWLAEWPPARHLADGSPSMSTNPFADYHLVYAVALIVLAVVGAGATWGLGKVWQRLPLVNRNPWLR